MSAERWTIGVCKDCRQQAHGPGSRCAKDRRRTWTPMTMVEVMPVSEHDAERASLSNCAEGWSQCAGQWMTRARGLEEAAREVLDALGHQNRHPIIDEAVARLRSALSEPVERVSPVPYPGGER